MEIKLLCAVIFRSQQGSFSLAFLTVVSFLASGRLLEYFSNFEKYFFEPDVEPSFRMTAAAKIISKMWCMHANHSKGFFPNRHLL